MSATREALLNYLYAMQREERGLWTDNTHDVELIQDAKARIENRQNRLSLIKEHRQELIRDAQTLNISLEE